MKNVTKSVVALAAAALLLGAASANAACTIYEHFDFKGKSGTVQDNQLLRFNAEGAPESTLMNRKVPTFRDASWFKLVSSVQTSDNCEAVFYNHGFGHRQFRTTAQLPQNYNDASQGMFCNCK